MGHQPAARVSPYFWIFIGFQADSFGAVILKGGMVTSFLRNGFGGQVSPFHPLLV